MFFFHSNFGSMEKISGYIIFVDDDKEEHELFEMAMRQICTCEILHAYDGDEALPLIHEHKNNIFAIISDISMPRITGLELKRIIEQTPLIKIMSIPFAFLTTLNDPVIVKEAYAFGIQGFLEKSGDLS